MKKTAIWIGVILLTFLFALYGIKGIKRAQAFFEYAPIGIRQTVEQRVTIGAAIVCALVIIWTRIYDSKQDDQLEVRREYLQEYGEDAFRLKMGRAPTDEERGS